MKTTRNQREVNTRTKEKLQIVCNLNTNVKLKKNELLCKLLVLLFVVCQYVCNVSKFNQDLCTDVYPAINFWDDYQWLGHIRPAIYHVQMSTTSPICVSVTVHKGDADHRELSEYQVESADQVDGLTLCFCSCPFSTIPTGVPINFTVQWSGLVHWLVSSAMLTQNRGTDDVIRWCCVSETMSQGSRDRLCCSRKRQQFQ